MSENEGNIRYSNLSSLLDQLFSWRFGGWSSSPGLHHKIVSGSYMLVLVDHLIILNSILICLWQLSRILQEGGRNARVKPVGAFGYIMICLMMVTQHMHTHTHTIV